jgi:Family of unknown function (DUF5719)
VTELRPEPGGREGSVAPSRSGRRRRRLTRIPVLVGVAVVVVGAALISSVASNPTPSAPAQLPSIAAASNAQASSWYCVGASGPSGSAPGAINLVNPGDRVVGGTMTVVNDSGASATAAVTVPAGKQILETPSQLESGQWLTARFDFVGGGVTVSQSVRGSAGWALSPCASASGTQWSFASGSTAAGNAMYISLFNPATTPAVADLTFVTSGGVVQPQPFQGIVIAPGHLSVVTVATYVQNQASVSTMINARSGRIVAGQFQVTSTGGVSGISLRLGTPSAQNRWTFPQNQDIAGGTTAFEVLNTSNTPVHVTAKVTLASGAVTPFTQTVPALALWTLTTSSQNRIPVNSDFAITFTASAPGISVDRSMQAPKGSASPQWGAVGAIDMQPGATAVRTWIIPAPGTPSAPAISGAAPSAIALANPGSSPVSVTVSILTAAGLKVLSDVPGGVPARGFVVLNGPTAAAAGFNPIIVQASGPIAVMENASPAAAGGIVALAGVPQTPS